MKLNYKRTILVGFAFFLISAFWSAYDAIIPLILTNHYGLPQTVSGIVMSVDEVCLAWSTLKRKQLKKMGATNRQDGEQNMAAIERYIAENGLSWKDFPAFEWCRAKGEGWYLPSINEIWSAGTMYMGGSRTAGNRRFRKSFNDRLVGAGGTPLSNIMYYHSSTEDKDAKYSLYTHMNSEAPFIQSGFKADDLFVRAFHKF
jgi:hypothetical protein